MKTVRSALLAAAVLAGAPSLAVAQPPEDGGRGGRPVGPGRFERSASPQGGSAAEQARPQLQSPQDFGSRQDFGDRQGFRSRPDQPPAQVDGQRPQGFGRDPAQLAQQRQPDGGFDRRPEGFNRGDGRRTDDRGIANRSSNNREPGFDRGFDNNDRFRDGDNRFDDDRFRGGNRRFDDNNRFRGDDRRIDNDNRFPGGDRRFDNNRFPGGGDRFRPDWRNDRRYDWRGYRDNNRQLFRAPRYLPPRGYGFGYRPFARGYQLQPFFYGQNYWIDDPWQYRLPPAYGPYRWVRYYNDVLLVDINTGFVVDVIQNFFW